jgi:GNAT superfamily N-acetyltransferase
VEVIAYEPAWLPRLAALARAHARLAPPGLILDDDEVAQGLTQHAYWPFYSPGLAGGQTLLVVEGEDLLAAGQVGFAGHGWGYGAAEGDGPDWLFDVHLCLFWLFSWPGWRESGEAAAFLAAQVVGGARSQGLPGVEAFRGGAGFLPFGTQLSCHWPHLREPLRAAGFRQPRDLVVYSGDTDPDAMPLDERDEGDASHRRRLEFYGRRGRVEAWLDGDAVGVAAASPLRGWDRASPLADPRATEWVVIRRLYVDAAARGRGVGTALLAEQLRRASARGARRFLLHIPEGPDDPPAHGLYLKFGRVVDVQQVMRVSF